MAKNYLEKLQKMEGFVSGNYNPFNHIIQSPSPSFNFCFGNSHGIPLGYSVALGGEPKSGKSLVSYAIAGQIHRDDPEAFVIKFDSEFRDEGQLSDEKAKMWGIDRDRLITFCSNDPILIFDRISKEIAALCEDGMKLKLLIIDSITGIRGRRSLNADTIATQQIGDEAKTLGDGLKLILPVQKKYKYAQILTCHVRAELDPLEQMRGNKIKMSLPWAVQHMCEYFMYIERDKTKAGRTDVNGNEFKDESKSDLLDNAESTGHKIKFKMKDSSVSPKGRSGEFTFSYDRGIINTHEEVFLLGKNRGILEMPNNRTYKFKDKQWTSREAMLTAIKDDSQLYKDILIELKKQDMAGKFKDETVE